jgi:hypothetical protein
MTKPMFLPVLFQVTVVPVFTQKSALLLAFGMLGVLDAAYDVRFTSTEQGVEPDPHVLLALHSCSGFASEQAYLLLFDCAVAQVANTTSGHNSKLHLIGKNRAIFIKHLTKCNLRAPSTNGEFQRRTDAVEVRRLARVGPAREAA